MKKIWITMIAIVAAASLTTGALAQGAGPKNGAPGVGQGKGQGKGQPGQGERRMGGGMRKMQEEIIAKLNLSKEQKAKVEALRKKQQAEFEKIRQGGERPDREKMKAMMEKNNKDFMAILTPQQQAQYKKLMEEARAKWQKENGGRQPGQRPGGKGQPPAGNKPPL